MVPHWTVQSKKVYACAYVFLPGNRCEENLSEDLSEMG